MRLLRLRSLAAAVTLCLPALASGQPPTWGTYNGNPQHTGISSTTLAPMNVIKWQTPVDLAPQYSGEALLIHYGSPLATAANTIVIPVKTGASNGFQVEGRNGYDGGLKWTQTSDYLLPPHNWTPSYSPAITDSGRLYFPGEGGTVFFRNNLDAAGNVTPTRLAFYGLSNYNANSTAARNNVFINTPITPDHNGNVYYGVQVTNTVTLGSQTLTSGGYIVRTDSSGASTFVAASAAASDSNIKKVAHSSALALSNDGNTVYAALTNAAGTGTGTTNYLVALNSTTLSTTGKVLMKDVNSPTNNARITESGSASPMVAPDGDVYMGVLENTTQYRSRGWMLHYSADLTQTKIASRFGWDDTASIVASSLVPSYSGSSPYLIMTKYNNYAGTGGDGKNRLGIFDPFNSEPDEIYGTQVAKLVISVLGLTPDDDFPSTPGAVREWCINAAAVDPSTKSILVNSEDGKSYRWDLVNNVLTETNTLTPGIGEAYTPTIIGPDGTGYAINNAILFALAPAAVPEPSTVILLTGLTAGSLGYLWRKRRQRRRADELPVVED